MRAAMFGVAAVLTLGSLVVFAIGRTREVPSERSLPFAVGAAAGGAIVRAVDDGSLYIGWFAIPIMLLLAPLLRAALSRSDRA